MGRVWDWTNVPAIPYVLAPAALAMALVGDVQVASVIDDGLARMSGGGFGGSGGNVSPEGSEQIEFPLSKNNKQHINKHNINSVKQQSKYLTDEQLAQKLDNSFFNPNWTTDEINKYAEEAYNALRSQGKTGNLTYEVNGEILDVFIHPDGGFGTVYGRYKFTVEQIRNILQ